jgi:hypothetical protein
VLRDSRIVGIVSRADLVRALAAGPTERTEPNGRHRSGLRAGAVAELDRRFRHRPPTAEEGRPVDASAEPDDTGLMAADFRRLVSDHKGQEVKHGQEQRRAAAAERCHRVAVLIDHHITEESWRGLMHQARLAAERGEKEFMLLRFPSQLCSDGGRAVNAGEPHWPATLRGEAAEICLYWELKLHGFRLAANVLDFPGGIMPQSVQRPANDRAVHWSRAVARDRLIWINVGRRAARHQSRAERPQSAWRE